VQRGFWPSRQIADHLAVQWGAELELPPLRPFGVVSTYPPTKSHRKVVLKKLRKLLLIFDINSGGNNRTADQPAPVKNGPDSPVQQCWLPHRTRMKHGYLHFVCWQIRQVE
jgi:hypothetical protein